MPRSVTIAITTYRRPDSLIRTLDSLRPIATLGVERAGSTEPPGWQVAEVLVVDNDRRPSAQEAVAAVADNGFPFPLRHVHEQEPGVSAARNRALAAATGQVLVFIDDDEQAEPGWPEGLILMMAETGAALVGGPVNTAFEVEPPSWVVQGRFFERANHTDGEERPWLRSGNLAIDLEQVRPADLHFDPAFGRTGGEDVAFTRQAAARGLGLRWSSTAPVTEQVGPDRTTRRWVCRRERTSTANWVRVEVGLDPTLTRRGYIALRALARLAQGAATLAVGAVTLHSSRVVKGLVVASRGIGSFEGLLDRRAVGYGDEPRPDQDRST